VLKQARRGLRLMQMADLVVKHGLGGALDLVGLAPRLFHRAPPEANEERSLPLAHRVRLLLQDLGPTFIKLGQIASTRSDLFGEDVVRELRKLQDQIDPFSYEEVEAVIAADLGKPIEEFFSYFEPKPLAAASIGQVHRARTLDNRDVVVKVQRPGVLEVIRNDMAILSWAARRLEARLEIARKMNVTGLLEEFEDLLIDELVYTIEGRNADRMRQNLAANPLIVIPEVMWDLTSRHVLTLEDVSGMKLDNIPALRAAGIHLQDLATGLSSAYIKQILIDGFFHGDPHQGNFLVNREGQIALVDFGIMGRLDEKTRDTLVSMCIAVFHQDSEEAVQNLVSLGAVSPDTDMTALTRDVDRLLSKYYFLPRHELRIGEIISRVLEVVYRHDVRMPTELALLAKVLLTIEGICIHLDPRFDFNASIRPFATELMERTISPRQLMREATRNAREISRIARVVPTQLMDVLSKLERGRLRVIVQYDHTDRTLDHLYEIANRVAMSIGLAAIMLGSGLILRTKLPPLIYGYPLFGYVGCVFSFAMLCRLLITLMWGLAPHRRSALRSTR